MVANPPKFQLIFPGTINANISIKVGNFTVNSVEIFKIPGVYIYSNMSFVPHVKELCKKSNQKIRALRRIRHLIPRKKAELLVNAYILSPFNYCPLTWMFCGKEGNKLITQSHHRALRVLLNENDKDYSDLLLGCGTVDIHTRNLRLMLIEVYKSLHNISPGIMQNIFSVRQANYELRSGEALVVPSYVRYDSTFGINTFDFRAVMAWNSLPSNVKSQTSVNLFKLALKRISPKCSCKICI